jgi:hypothetical protein
MGGAFLSQRIWVAVALVCFTTVMGVGPARADTIIPMFFDGFETEPGDVLNSSLLHWNITAGNIDVLAPGNLCGPAGNASQCLDLDGTGPNAGTIATMETFDLQPDTTYRLSFDLAGANRIWKGSATNTVRVALGYYFWEEFTLTRWDPFQTFVRDFIPNHAGLASISFQHFGNDYVGLLLDNVSLSRIILDTPPNETDPPEEPDVTPVPEPGTWSLFAAGLGILAWRRWKQC